jgi:hypothetical protein
LFIEIENNQFPTESPRWLIIMLRRANSQNRFDYLHANLDRDVRGDLESTQLDGHSLLPGPQCLAASKDTFEDCCQSETSRQELEKLMDSMKLTLTKRTSGRKSAPKTTLMGNSPLDPARLPAPQRYGKKKSKGSQDQDKAATF